MLDIKVVQEVKYVGGIQIVSRSNVQTTQFFDDLEFFLMEEKPL